MKKSLLTILCTLLSVFSWAQGTTAGDGSAEAYAVLTDNQDIISQDATGITYGKTLTFYYDTNKSTYPDAMSVGPFTIPVDRAWENLSANITSVVIEDSFANNTTLSSTAYWFYGFQNLATITGLSNLNTGNVTDMQYMFYDCSLLESVDVSGFNTANVTNMSGLFYKCHKLQTLNLSNFNTFKVTNMSWMFYGCNELTKIYAGSYWTTSSVNQSEEMFVNCTKLVGSAGTTYDESHVDASYAHIDLAPSNPGYLSDPDASSYNEAYAVLSENNTVLTFYYDTNKSTHPDAMSVGPFSLASERGWNSYMTDITTVVFDDSFANATNITSTAYWFADCSSLTEIRGIGNLNTSNVTTMLWMFCGCTSLSSIDLSGFNTVNVTDMSYMFMRTGFTSLDLSSFSTYKVTQTDNMFRGCFGLTTIYVGSDWNTGAITSGADMFLNCSNLVGGAGTTYNANRIDYTFAHIDGGENNPGYFTDKNAPASYVITVTSYGNGQVSVEGVLEVVEDGKKAEVAVTAGGSLEMFFFPGEGYQLDSLMVDGVNVTADVVPATEQSAASYTLNNISAAHNVITYFGEKASYNEAYAVLVSEDGGNIMYATLYYDGNKASHTEGFAVVGLDEMLQNQAWMMNRSNIKTVNFDESFANCNPTSTAYWFAFCNSLTAINGLQYLNTEFVTNMEYMFHMCPALSSIDLSHFRAKSLTNMNAMFGGCSSLTSLDLSGFFTFTVTNMNYLFSGCTNLKTIYVNKYDWSTESVTAGDGVFENCTSLVGGAGTTFNDSHIDYTYARIDGGPNSTTPGYFTDIDASASVVAPEFRFEGDNLAMTTETQNASIFYKVAELPSMAEAVVDSVKNSLIVTPDGQQSTYYEHPFELKMAAVVKAIAVADNATGTIVSDTTTMVYDYEAWVNLKAAVESGTDLYGRAQGNPNVDTQLLEQLQWALNEGDMIYNNRAQMDSFEATHFTQRINELCAQIEAQMAEDEPYAVLSDNDTKLTFYYDKKKATNNGMSVGPFRDRTESGWYSARKTITNVVFDDSFANCTSLTSTADWFAELAYLTTITGIGNLKTDNVTDMSNMFLFCRSLTSLDVTGFNTSNVTSMENMFYECSSLTSLDVSHFNTANVTNMDMMFQLCSGLTSLDVSNFNTSSLTHMLQMFCQCSSLKKLTLGNFNTDKVIVMSGLLGGCSSLTEIDLSSLNTSSVESLFLMFDGCTSLKTLDLSNFNTARVTNMIQMFYGCSNLKTVYVGDGWTTLAVTDSENMFLDCTSLVGGAGTHYDANHVDVAYAHIDGGSANPGYFTRSGDAPWVDPTEQVATPYFRMESDYNNEVAIKTDTDEAEIFYTQNSRMIQGNDTDFGFGDWNLNWKVSGSNSSYQVTSGGYNNSYCLKLTSVTASTFGSAQAGYKFVSALTKDTYYTLRFKARSESGRGQLQVFCQNDTIDNTRSTVDTLAIGSELTDYEVTFKIQNENTNQIVLNFGAVADTYYIDNVLFGAVVSDTTNQMRTRYEQPINLREGATIKAVATKQGMLESSPAVLDYFYDGWMNLRAVYEMAGAITNECYGDPNVPLQMVQDVEVRVAERYYRLWDRRGREHVDDTELLETYDELRYILDELYRMKSGFTVDGVSYHAVDSTQVEVIPSLESYYRGAITVPATVNYNNINFRVTTVAQNAFRSEYLTAIFWYAGFALKATDLQSSQNPNLLLYVTEASMAPTDRDNVVINGFAKNIRLSEGGNFHCPQAFTAEAISYTREFKQQTQIGVSRGWETIALPFTVQTITHEQRGVIAPFGNTASNTHFWLRRLTSNGLQAVPTIEANTAYLISMPNSEEYVAEYNLPGRVTFSAENATVPMTEIVKDESADYVMTPCFTNAAAKQGIYVLNVGEQRSGYPEGSIFESNYRAVLPFQAYVEHKGSNPAPPYFIVGDLGGDTTGIMDNRRETITNNYWYTLDGRKLQGKPTQKGVYITNGKKVIIK